jgi:hypothetical protein
MPKTVKVLRTDLLRHEAVLAWAEFGPARVEPDRIEVLKRGRKGAVYRLAGVGPENSAVIAKRCRPDKGEVERMVYEEVLPRLPVPTLRCYGSVGETKGEACWLWLFLEDVGAQRYSPIIAKHRSLAARWLGEMNVAGEGLNGRLVLPDRGPDHYRLYLRSALEKIGETRTTLELDAAQQAILEDIDSLCTLLEERWSELESFCDRMPRTFVHGDCLVKNVHVRATRTGAEVLAPFDWGGAGWGLPATDLGQLGLPHRKLPPTRPDFEAYAAAARARGRRFDTGIVLQLTNLGQLFWALKVISRGTEGLEPESNYLEEAMYNMRVYAAVLADTIRSARWDE